MAHKIKIATASLAGCFGCHMSILDIDEKLFELVGQVEFDRSPLTDIKQISHCDIGIVEGAVANAENVEVLRQFRKSCDVLVAMGACALNGGVPALRNHFSVEECLRESYLEGTGIDNPMLPDDPELPMLLNQVYPVHEVVKVDFSLPGCPPPADLIWEFLSAVLQGREFKFQQDNIHYD